MRLVEGTRILDSIIRAGAVRPILLALINMNTEKEVVSTGTQTIAVLAKRLGMCTANSAWHCLCNCADLQCCIGVQSMPTCNNTFRVNYSSLPGAAAGVH
jgi:hypothetical protein